MKKLTTIKMLIGLLVLLITYTFTTTADARKILKDGKHAAEDWYVLTYDAAGNILELDVTLIPKNKGISFDFYPTPDRAMLLTEMGSSKKSPLGHLTGKTLSAHIAIKATPGATFNYFNNDGTGSLQGGWADPGGFVRLYFNKVNTPGCPTGWHPERPDCEAQYWWSNPVHIDLADLAALGSKGIELEVPLDAAFWSDRDGHMGNTPPEDVCWSAYDSIPAGCMNVDHVAAFNAAVADVHKIGLSFGGDGWWAFGCGVNAPGGATFMLYEFDSEKPEKH
jgi:hypothetical protein